MNKNATYQELRSHLAYLKLAATAEHLPGALERAEQDKRGYTPFLADLLAAEVGFEDTTVAAAILDRLLHHATVLQIDGESYRMRGHRARLTQLRASLNQGVENSRSQVGNSDDR
jgi:IstB-like ATP binding protein